MDINNIKIGFIGAGKVGTGLGVYFASRGKHIAGYYSRSIESAKAAAALTKACAFTDMFQLALQCDLIFITTPDDQIASAWNELTTCNLKNKIICHTSGAVSSAVFERAKDYGVYAYSVHPMFAFPNKSGSVNGIENAYFTIEGDAAYLQDMAGFISSLGNTAQMIDTENKALYHIANVMVSNLVLALLYASDSCLQQSGISAENSLQSLLPLIIGNINNITENGFIPSLTGPVERNDTHTIGRHLEALPKQYGDIYARLSFILSELAIQKHSDRDYSILRNQLNDYVKKLSEERLP